MGPSFNYQIHSATSPSPNLTRRVLPQPSCVRSHEETIPPQLAMDRNWGKFGSTRIGLSFPIPARICQLTPALKSKQRGVQECFSNVCTHRQAPWCTIQGNTKNSFAITMVAVRPPGANGIHARIQGSPGFPARLII